VNNKSTVEDLLKTHNEQVKSATEGFVWCEITPKGLDGYKMLEEITCNLVNKKNDADQLLTIRYKPDPENFHAIIVNHQSQGSEPYGTADEGDFKAHVDAVFEDKKILGIIESLRISS
jgi:hypothetical protein